MVLENLEIIVQYKYTAQVHAVGELIPAETYFIYKLIPGLLRDLYELIPLLLVL